MNFIEDSCAWHSCKGKHVQSRDRAERPNVNGFHTPQPTGIALRQNTHSIKARSQMLKKRQDFAGRFLFPVKDGRIMPKNLAEQGRKPRRPTVDMKSCQTVQRIQRVNLLYCF